MSQEEDYVQVIANENLEVFRNGDIEYEVYIHGYFLTSVIMENVSEEAKRELDYEEEDNPL